MASTVKLLAIVDLEGNIVAAQLADRATDSEDLDKPSVSLLPAKGQYVVNIEVPQEVLDLPGPDLHQFLSNVEISWPADVHVPSIEVVGKH